MNKNEILYKSRVFLTQETSKPFTLDEIARLLQCSKKTIYKHFDNKKQLYSSVFEYYIAEQNRLFMNLQVSSIPLELRFSIALKEIHNFIRNLTKSALFLEVGDDNSFLELYYQFRLSCLEETLNSLIKAAFVRDLSNTINASFLINIIEARYFNRNNHTNKKSDETFLAELNHICLANIYYFTKGSCIWQ